MKKITVSCIEGNLKFRLSSNYFFTAKALSPKFPHKFPHKPSFNELGEYIASRVVQDNLRAISCCYTGIDYLNFLNAKLEV